MHNCRFGANCAIQKLIGGKLFSNKIFPRLISRCFFGKSFFLVIWDMMENKENEMKITSAKRITSQNESRRLEGLS